MDGFVTLLQIILAVGFALLFVVLPFAICGWAFGKLRSYGPALGMFAVIAFFWTFIMSLDSGAGDHSNWAQRYWVWLAMVAIFAVSAVAGWFVRTRRISNSGQRHVHG